MDHPTKTSDFGTDTSPLSRTEHLRALKKGNEGRTLLDPLPVARATAAIPGAGYGRIREKRRRPRYKCEGSVVFRTQGIDMRTWATFTDISLGGCYVELAATLPVRTPVNMALDVKGVQVEVKGIVRTSYPLVGMGIEFTEIAERERLGLEEILRRLEGNPGLPGKLPLLVSPATAFPLLVVDPAAALNAVASFFQDNQALTRELCRTHEGAAGQEPR
jgi:hypothetical protein